MTTNNKFGKQTLYFTHMYLCFVSVTVFFLPTVCIDCPPQIPAEETMKEGRKGRVPIYLNTILSYASFISDSDHLTCYFNQFHTACPTARSPNTCYSPGLTRMLFKSPTITSCRTQSCIYNISMVPVIYTPTQKYRG